ncbi:MAG: hypothetical protein HN337_02070 [Deltaproteobacteria bacterium]|jgi:hypothetical protein|nr:hypothetical protein [Deltaproteobacteria bacterium]
MKIKGFTFFLAILILTISVGLSGCGNITATGSSDDATEDDGSGNSDDGADQGISDVAGDDGESSPDSIAEGDDGGIGQHIGSFKWTFYWVEFEGDHAGVKDGTIYLEDGTAIPARQSFVDNVKVEGTGYLDDSDDTMINLDEWCPHDPDGKCFFLVDTDLFPYGVGAYDNPLHPWRTVATDVSAHIDVDYAITLYIPDLDGVELPATDLSIFDPSSAGFAWNADCGCYLHDGCVFVEDSGVSGLHLDFFALSEDAYWDIGDGMNWASPVDVYIDSPLCE